MADYDSDYVEEEEKIADINVTQTPAKKNQKYMLIAERPSMHKPGNTNCSAIIALTVIHTRGATQAP